MITTETANRPTGKVRSSDPDYYDTFFDWNVHDLLVERENPSGNRIVYTYETAQKRIANVSKIERFDSEAENEALTEEFSHFAMYADCRCGEQFITRYTAKDENGQTDYDIAFQFDTAGNRTAISYGALSDFPSTFHETFLYNANGQVTAHVFPDNGSAGGYQRRDEMAYYTTGPQTGYLESITADANGQALKTTFAYNAAGRVTGITEPRGHSGGMPQGSWTTLLTYNSNDELIRWRSAEPSGGVARNQVDYVYDANGNVVAVEVENRDAAGILQPNAEFVTTYTYDSLNRQTQAVAEVDESTAVTTQVQYTRNGLPLRILSPLAVSGAEPANTEVRLYDERDLLYRLERGSGSPGQVTTQFDYDANGNLTTATAGLEESAGNRRVTQNVYDAFDRLDTVTDPLGHVRDYAYDGAGRLTQGKVLADGTTLLSQVDYTYDLSGRNTEIARALLDASGAVISGTVNGVDTGNGVSTTTITYTAASDVKTVDFEGHVTEYAYDTLLRLASVTDPKGNVVAYSYDGNSNVVEATSTEQDDTGGPDQEFQTLLSYDQLNRLVARSERYSTVSGGQYNTQTFGYDSRDNRVSRADARGFVATFGYDGLSRPVSSAHEVTAGVWATTATAYDGNSRLISRTDPNGNVTSHAYDALNRPIRVTYADGTAHTLAYNRFGDLTGRTDPTGTTTSQAFDKLGRLTGRTYNPATGFDNPGAKSFTYDALSRMTSATDTDSVAEFEYDSLGNVWNESLTIGGGAERTVASVFDDNGTRKRVTYPGGWTATYTHDDLERVTGIADGGGSIAGYAYVGARMARRTHGNGTQTDYTYDGHGTVNLPGDFGVGRVVEAHHTVTGPPYVSMGPGREPDQTGGRADGGDRGRLHVGLRRAVADDGAHAGQRRWRYVHL
jgi:YD repeat-containing protein